jgi:oxygen-dependent protoporphyrinogen oxidase
MDVMREAPDLIDRARRTRVVVVGGGVAGLVASFEFAKVGMSVTVVEQSGRWGGSLAAADLGGAAVDPVVDAFDSSLPELRALLDELGLAPSVDPIAPAPMRIGSVTLPAESVLGIPGNPWDPAVRRLVGWRGVWRAYLDRLRPPLTIGHQRNLGSLVRSRMGARVLERLVAPVTRATLGLDPDDVDVERAAPGLLTALTRTGSLAGAASELSRRQERRAGVTGGTHRIAGALVDRLSVLGAELRTGVAARVVRVVDGRFEIETDAEDGDAAQALTADIVVVATGPHAARTLLAGTAELPDAPTASVDVVLLRLSHGHVDAPLDLCVPDGGALRRITRITGATGGEAREEHVLRVLLEADAAATDDAQVQRARHAASTALGMPIAAADVTDSVRMSFEWPLVADLGRDSRTAAVGAAVAAVPGLAVVGAWACGGDLAATVAHAVDSAGRRRHAALWSPESDRAGDER